MSALPFVAPPVAGLAPAHSEPCASPVWVQGIWRADALGQTGEAVCATGHAALDAELPGGGWPLGALTELLQLAPTDPLWPLLLPALAQRPARLVLVAPPLPPFMPALAAGGVPAEAVLCVQASDAPARLWACEQALRCADVAAVLAWLPQARPAELRRLQLAAARQGSLLFVLRPAALAQAASPARLRLLLDTRPAAPGQPATLAVHLLKRRGPPGTRPVLLPAHGPALATLLAAAQQRRRGMAGAAAGSPAAGARVLPWPHAGRSPSLPPGAAHALDRTALATP